MAKRIYNKTYDDNWGQDVDNFVQSHLMDTESFESIGIEEKIRRNTEAISNILQKLVDKGLLSAEEVIAMMPYSCSYKFEVREENE